MIKLNDSFTKEQHKECGDTLKTIHNELRKLMHLVGRAPYTDAIMQVELVIQKKLIDPLRTDYQNKGFDRDEYNPRTSNYASVGYGVPWPKGTPR